MAITTWPSHPIPALVFTILEQADALDQALANQTINALIEEPNMAVLTNEAQAVDTAAANVPAGWARCIQNVFRIKLSKHNKLGEL